MINGAITQELTRNLKTSQTSIQTGIITPINNYSQTIIETADLSPQIKEN